jgi:GNAT superfamily N-acetyltransferase
MISKPLGVLPIFAASRAVLFAISLYAVVHLPINATEAQGFHLAVQPHPLLEAWARYDACWYVAIAEGGYRGPIGPWGDMRPGFFPLFPALVTALTSLVRVPLLAGLIVANACYLTFLVLLWKLVRLDWAPEVARRTVWIYLLFPSAIFLSGVYSESVLLALATGALLAARRRHWLGAGLMAALATLARPVGIVIVAALVAELIAARRADVNAIGDAGDERPGFSALLFMVAPIALAAVGYFLFAASTFGDPFAVLSSQAAIRGPMTPPWQPFIDLWHTGARLHAYDRSLIDAALALMAVAALPAIFKHVRPSYAVYACLVVLVPLSGSLISFNRMLLPSFPHAILLGRFVTNRWAVAVVLMAFGILEVFAMTAFATWNWVA